MAVAVSGPPWRVRLRRRVALAETGDTETNEVYHRAREEGLRVVEAAVATATRMARASLQAMAKECPGVRAIGVVLGNSNVPQDVDAILRSHPLLHAAEGRLYAGALLQAGAGLGLAARAVPSRSLEAHRRRLAEVARPPGPPWGADEKDAVLVALVSLDAGDGPAPVGGGARRSQR